MASGTQQQEHTLVAPATFPLRIGRLEVVAPSRPTVDETAERVARALQELAQSLPATTSAATTGRAPVLPTATGVAPALQTATVVADTLQTATVVAPATTATTIGHWRALLPELEAELADELKAFRRAMRSARIAPDYLNRDIVPSTKSGAWMVFHAEQEIDGRPLAFSVYVRRCANQLAVNENASRHGLSPLFTQAFPWDPPTADDVRLGLQTRLRTCAGRRRR